MASSDNLSIHPRNWRETPAGSRSKQNTSARKSRSTVERAIRGISDHVDRHPSDIMSKTRLDRLKATLREFPAA